MIIKGTVWKYGDHIDTDVIIPARYLNLSTPEELARHCMEDIDPHFASAVQKGDIIVAGENFGCGSSREHAPLAIKGAGVSCVVARSFARIFYRNAINIGLPILECPAAVEETEMGHQLEIDLEAGRIRNLITGRVYQAEPYPPFMLQILNAGGLIAYTRQVLAGAGPQRESARSSSPAQARPSAAYRIAVLPGDGIGSEVIAEAEKVLQAVSERFGHQFVLEYGLVGGAAMAATGHPLPAETLALCKSAHAILFGAVGDPRYDDPRSPVRPEQAILGLRKELGLFANLRPVWVHPALADASPVRPDRVDGVDFIIVRELTGGIYFGQPRVEGTEQAVDTMVYTRAEVERIAHVAFQLARKRRRKVSSVDKANVLACSRLWRSVVTEVTREYPDVELEHLLVDAASMHLIRRPRDFDVILTENLFGDILSDEASVLSGSMGMLPSASLGEDSRGLYEPVHGSAPDIAGRSIANPLAAILSVAMLLRHSLHLEEEARAVEIAVATVLEAGYRTPDIAPPGSPTVSTRQMGDRIVDALRSM